MDPLIITILIVALFGLVMSFNYFVFNLYRKRPFKQVIDPRSQDPKNEIARELLTQLLTGPAVIKIEVVEKGSLLQWVGHKD